MAYNLKTRIVDTTFDPSTALLFGGDSQASSQPSVYEASKISDALAAEAKTLTNKTLVAPVVDTIHHASGGILTVPNATGTLARIEDIGPSSGYTSPMVTRGQMLRRGASADEAFAPNATGDALVFDGTDMVFAKRGFANVTDAPYSAVGDNVADDTAEIQACLDANLHVRLGGPGLTFRVSDTLNLRSGHVLDLAGATVKQVTSQKPLFDASGETAVTVIGNGGTLQGHGNDYVDSATSQAIGIKCESSARVRVDGVRFYNFCYSAVGSGTGASKSSDLVVVNCHIVGPGSAILTPGVSRNCAGVVAYADRARISNNTITATGQGLIVAQESTNVIVSDNDIHDITVEHGMYIDSGVVGITITGNNIQTVYSSGIKVQWYDAVTVQPQSVAIVGNAIKGCAHGEGILLVNTIPTGAVYRLRSATVVGNAISEVAIGYGINARYLDGATISENTIYNCNGGIYSSYNESGSIANNTIRFTNLFGIADAGTSNFLHIHGNQIYDWGRNYSTDEDRTAILITGGAGHRIAGNHMTGNTARAKYGVWLSAGTQSTMVVFDNTVRGVSGYGVRLQSPKAVILLCDQNSLEATTGGGSVLNIPDTVALLPTAAAAGPGARRYVTDATSSTFMATATGGGANKVPVMSNGTGWVIG